MATDAATYSLMVAQIKVLYYRRASDWQRVKEKSEFKPSSVSFKRVRIESFEKRHSAPLSPTGWRYSFIQHSPDFVIPVKSFLCLVWQYCPFGGGRLQKQFIAQIFTKEYGEYITNNRIVDAFLK